jgi:hypothetical protein
MDPDHLPDQDDLENPYAPPDSTFGPDPLQAQLGTISFDVGDLLNWTWALYKERLRICLMIIWGVFGINCGISIFSNLLRTALETAVRDPILFAVSQIAIAFGTWVLGIWLNVGANLAFLKIARREEVAFEDVFTGGRYVLTTILASILFALSVGGPILLALIGGAALLPMIRDNQAGTLIILILIVFPVLVAVAVYLSIRLFQFYFVVIDRNAGVIESLRTSWYLTKNQVPTLFLVYLLQASIILAGVLALCVGLFFAVPLASLLLAVTYHALAGQSPAFELQFLDTRDEEIRKDLR